MDWGLLRGVPDTPEFSMIPYAREWYREYVYRIGDAAYALSGSAPRNPPDFVSERITSFIWAPDVAAIERFVFRRHVRLHRGSEALPAKLGLRSECNDFSTLCAAASTGQFGKWLITQVPDSRWEGDMVGTLLSVGRLDYYFESCKPQPAEKPCSVHLLTSDMRWLPLGLL